MNLKPAALLPSAETSASLYELDETGWLEQMSVLIRERRFAALDYENIAEYLADMARRDKREVLSRLTVLMAHWLKWEFQPERRSPSWRLTITEQRRELAALVEGGTLANHAKAVLAKAYKHAIEDAAIETGLPESTFPAVNSRTVEEWLTRADFDEPPAVPRQG